MKKSAYIFGAIVLCGVLAFAIVEANAAFWRKQAVNKRECGNQYKEKCNKRCDPIILRSDRDKCLKKCEKDLPKECQYNNREQRRVIENPKIERNYYQKGD